MHFLVTEVHNFGGFFGGDTINLSGRPWGEDDADEETLTIDAAALRNVPQRHHVTAGMVFALTMIGERVERAELLAALDQAALRQALGRPQLTGPFTAPLRLSARCGRCERWVVTNAEARCPLCGADL
jgi:hypothetical protein